MTAATLYGVGVGPGDPELLTVKALRTIEACPTIAAPRTKSGAMLAYDIASRAVSMEGKRIVPLEFAMSRDPNVLAESHERAAQAVLEELRAERSVALLNLGDVSIFATFSYLVPFVREAGFDVVMVPGVPSFCAVAAALGENLTPRMDAPLHIVPAGFSPFEDALSFPGTKVVMKAGKPLARVKEDLRAAGLYERASLVQNCSLPDERVARSLDDAVENDGYFTTMVVRA